MTLPIFGDAQARRRIRMACAGAALSCDYVFAAARGVPRQGALRAAIDAQRLARSAHRATPGKRA